MTKRAMPVGRVAAPRVAVVSALALAFAGCDLITGPGGENAATAIISDARATPAAATAVFATLSAPRQNTTYISLRPGTAPDGISATLLNRATGQALPVPLVDGGFDPVGLLAEAGDTIAVEIWRGTGIAPLTLTYEVPEKRRPVVVRTSPPRGKRDVVLNSVLVVVFSEPIDAGTLTGENVQLTRGAEIVPGTLQLTDSEGLVATFVPEAPLAPATAYRLLVGTGIRDLSGDPLESAAVIDFTTGTAESSAASLSLDQPGLTLAPGEQLPVTAVGRDVAGNLVTAPVSWSSADPEIATVSPDGVVTAVSRGETTLHASAGELTASAAVRVAELAFATVDGGWLSTCGVSTAGEAYCWGDNAAGQLGDGTTRNRSTPGLVSGGIPFVSVSAGSHFSCGLAADGLAYCWGLNRNGQLGTATDGACPEGVTEGPASCSTVPVPVVRGLTFTALSAGGSHACALTADQLAYCWGSNGSGQLGDGTTADRFAPVAVAGGLRFATVNAGFTSWGGRAGLSCGTTINGEVYCWGTGGAALGYGSGTGPELCGHASCSTVPTRVASDLTFATVKAGHWHACALTTGGDAHCWGNLAQGDSVPVLLPGDLRHVALDAAEGGYADYGSACSLTSDGVGYCWDVVYGGDGPGSAWAGNSGDYAAKKVAGDMVFTDITTGASHRCGVTSSGNVYCWGWNFRGELGNGWPSPAGTTSPVRVKGQR